MNLHVDIPTHTQIEHLLDTRARGCVSLYMPTDPASRGDAERIELKNLAGEAVRQLQDSDAPRSDVAAIDAALNDLLDDGEFWRYQARSVAVFASPQALTTFRLPNRLVSSVEVSDRFHLKPLLRSVTFPQVAFLLALAQNSVRLLEVLPDQPPSVVDVPDLAPAPFEKGRLRQYARSVDQALRPVLNSLEVPLILAAAEPLNSIFRSVNSYPYLAAAGVPGNPETTSDADLAASGRSVLDELYAGELDRLRRLYEQRSAERRVLSDIAEVARAATAGAVDTVFVDIDEVVPGTVDEESGAVSFSAASDAVDYGVVDEIARRAWLNGGRVLAVRRDDIPGNQSVAAILRYPI